MNSTAHPVAFATWIERRPGARFTDWLREANAASWDAATNHRFCDEIADGSLTDADFGRYLIQDYAFIETLVTVIGFAVARSPDMETKKVWSGFLSVLTSDENDYFQRSFRAINVSPRDLDAVQMSATTAQLRNVMLDAANSGSYADILAVVVPAEWTYLQWASTRKNSNPPQPQYAEWIELHAIPEFEAFVDWLREQLDALGPSLSDDEQASVAARFSRVMELEVAFFDQAYA